jgi:plasmid stabilization system protein ParE
MKIIRFLLAIDRISEIADYIAHDNISASIKWIEDIFNEVDQLLKFPESGRIIPEIAKNNIREFIFGNYRIIYQMNIKDISILTIRHFKQILPLDEIT